MVDAAAAKNNNIIINAHHDCATIEARTSQHLSIHDDDDDDDTPKTETKTPVAKKNKYVITDRLVYSNFWLDVTGSYRCTPSVRAVDRIYQTDGSFRTRIIDVPSSFSPQVMMRKHQQLSSSAKKLNNTKTIRLFNTLSTATMLLWKASILGMQGRAVWITIPVLKAGWFSFLSHWAMSFAIIYSVLSLVNTFFPITNNIAPKTNTTTTTATATIMDADPSSSSSVGIVSRRTMMTWFFFTLAAHSEVTISVLYWALVYDGTTNTYVLLAHGIVGVCILVDGLCLSRIPIRLRHWLEWIVPMYILYFLWTVMHSSLVFDIQNPYFPELGDRIYPFVDWASHPVSTLQIGCGLIFGFTPVVHISLWGISLLGRRYVDDNNDTTTQKINNNTPEDDPPVADITATGFDNEPQQQQGTRKSWLQQRRSSKRRSWSTNNAVDTIDLETGLAPTTGLMNAVRRRSTMTRYNALSSKDDQAVQSAAADIDTDDEEDDWSVS